MTKGRFFVLGFILSFSLIRCTETVAPEYEAKQMTLEQLRSTPGYSWFDLEMSLYEPDTQLVAAIADAYQPGVHHFTFFIKPECQCKGTTKLFPRIVRILFEASVSDTAMTIYSMRSPEDKYPRPDIFQLKKLPTIFCTRQGTVVGQISELPSNGEKLEAIILQWLLKR